MDGTLTLSIHDFEAIKLSLGITANKPILEAIEDMPPDRATAALQKLFDIEMEIAAQATPQPGATELLEHLLSCNCKVGILTRNGVDIAHKTLQATALVGYFETKDILGRESCAPKPDPAGVHLHLSRWNATPADSVMVGDYLFDLEAGFRAGVQTVHLDVANGEQWPDITTARVTNLGELLGLIS